MVSLVAEPGWHKAASVITNNNLDPLLISAISRAITPFAGQGLSAVERALSQMHEQWGRERVCETVAATLHDLPCQGHLARLLIESGGENVRMKLAKIGFELSDGADLGVQLAMSVQLAKDESPKVRSALAQYAHLYPNSGQLAFCLAEDEDPQVRLALANNLPHIQSREDIAYVLSCDPHENVRAAVFGALGHFSKQLTDQILTEAFREGTAGVRLAAAKNLHRLSPGCQKVWADVFSGDRFDEVQNAAKGIL